MRVSRGFRLPRQAPLWSRVGARASGTVRHQRLPVLSAAPTPHTPLSDWNFTIRGAVDHPASWTWDEFRALPSETVTADIHCVTKWSKLDTYWRGVSLDTLLQPVETTAEYVLAFCDGGYT